MLSDKIVREEKCNWITSNPIIKVFIFIILMFLFSSCSEPKEVRIAPIGEPDNLIVTSDTVDVTIFYPMSSGSISKVTMRALGKDRPFFNLWKEYASVPDDIVLLNYNIIKDIEDQIEMIGSSKIETRKFGDTYVMEIDISANFKDYITNEREDCIMTSLVKTLLLNESSLSPECGSIKLTINGSPLITENRDYTEPLTIKEFGQSCDH